MEAVEQELAFYPDIDTVYTKITCVENTGNENMTQFTVSNGTMTWIGSKLRTDPL